MDEQDRFDREGVIRELTRRIVDNAAPPAQARFISVVGLWGSGKTWILDRVRLELGGHTREFNPWLFSDELGLYRGFATFLLERIQDRRARKRIATALDYIGPSMKGFGFDTSGTAHKAAVALHGLDSPTMIREALKKSFSKTVGPAYILVDDLDRLTPDELLLFFKLVRLIGDIPGLVYILAYDEEALLAMLAKTPIAGSVERARQYLEKIVEHKISVPRMTRAQWTREVLEPLVKFGINTHPLFAADVGERDQFVWRIESFGWQVLATPRVITRYLDAVRALPMDLQGEVNFLDWCAICLLRVAYPGAWQIVRNHPDVFAGVEVASALRTLTDGQRALAKQVAETVESTVGTSYERDDLMDMLDFLFPTFAANRTGEAPSYGYATGEKQRIGNAEFFDRYFTYNLPRGEVPDMLVHRLLGRLELVEEHEAATKELCDLFAREPEAVLRTIRHRWKSVVSVGTLYPFLAELRSAPQLEYSVGAFGLSGSSQLRVLAEEVLRYGTEAELEQFAFASTEDADSLRIEILLAESRPAGSQHYVQWVQAQRALLEERAADELEGADSPVSGDIVNEWFLRLRRLNPGRAQSLIKQALQNGRWSAEDVAGANITWVTTSRQQIATLDRVRIHTVVSEDAGLVALLRAGTPTSYPPEWDEGPASRPVQGLPLRLLGSYVLTHWNDAIKTE